MCICHYGDSCHSSAMPCVVSSVSLLSLTLQIARFLSFFSLLLSLFTMHITVYILSFFLVEPSHSHSLWRSRCERAHNKCIYRGHWAMRRARWIISIFFFFCTHLLELCVLSCVCGRGESYVCVCGLLCCLSAAAWQCQLPLPFTVNVLTLTVCFSRVSGERRPYLTYPVNKYLRGILWI